MLLPLALLLCAATPPMQEQLTALQAQVDALLRADGTTGAGPPPPPPARDHYDVKLDFGARRRPHARC